MSDIKLFQLNGSAATELAAKTLGLERSLQNTIEKHLETFLGVRFLASEYSTGKNHHGRIDTLGIDENGSPVIIEYKRQSNQNIINQGLFYLSWLLDHQAEFELLVLKAHGQETADRIEWSSPRLLCIAGDFTRYDEHAVQQMNRNIELIRYRCYGENLYLFELVNSATANDQKKPETTSKPDSKEKVNYKTVSDYLEDANEPLKELFDSVKDYLLGLGDDATMKTLKYYFAFRRIKNFACIEIHPKANKMLAYGKLDPDGRQT